LRTSSCQLSAAPPARVRCGHDDGCGHEDGVHEDGVYEDGGDEDGGHEDGGHEARGGAVRIIVLGAGNVGRAVVDALYSEHDITVIDVDEPRLTALADRYDVRTVEGNGTTKRVMREAGIEEADLLIACSPREEANLVSAMLARKLSASARVIVRTSSVEYLEAWREREIDVDFMVSSELETAIAISGLIGIPAARQTDVFADGKVQIVEFDVPPTATSGPVIKRPLREAEIPPDSKVVAIIRGDRLILPRGVEAIEPGDRVVIIAAPASALEWSRLIARSDLEIDDLVVFGAGQMGSTIARVLLGRDVRVRLVDSDHKRALDAAEALPEARVFCAHAFDSDFLERERIGNASAAVFCLNDDAKNLYAAVLARAHGVRLTIALAHDPASVAVYESGGVDVAINPRQVIAEEFVRFAHDPRIRQIAMLEGDRFEILDLTVREESELANRRFDDLPHTGSVIGAIIREGKVIFPHGSDVLLPGDRVIIFVESRRAALVEKVL
jgi:trk system potassium uptake protein TrkA